ncbi:MAG: hypothetical protein AAFV71_18065 [Cyanobacteria bacterium J06633_8]
MNFINKTIRIQATSIAAFAKFRNVRVSNYINLLTPFPQQITRLYPQNKEYQP